MKACYYDPFFYICSDEMPFTIRIQIIMKEQVDGDVLAHALRTAMRRYPYFAIEVIEEDGELLTVHNDRPIVAYEGKQPFPLGGDEVNRHLIAASYCGREISLYTSHVITDGGGFYPLIKSFLYYYVSERYHVALDPDGFRLAEDPFFDDETGNPYPEAHMRDAAALYDKKPERFFRLRDGGFVTDTQRTVFRFRVNEAEVMAYNHDHDGSPCALFSSLMAKAVWSLHPDLEENLVSAVSCNLRPCLGNRHSYRLLSGALFLTYPKRLRDADVAKLCTCSRGMVTLQNQPENVLQHARQWREQFDGLDKFPGVSRKMEHWGKIALEDACRNTFSVSYVGNMGLGEPERYIDAMYNMTDGSTWQSVFIEVMLIDGWFDIAFLQGFSSDVYYRAFLEQLRLCSLGFREDEAGAMDTPKIVLPGV